MTNKSSRFSASFRAMVLNQGASRHLHGGAST